MLPLTLFLKSFLIGLAIAAPVGPIGMLCIRKTLELGLLGGLSVGLGAALADTVYGVIAGAGLTMLSDFLIGKVTYIKFIGGAFLLFLGFKELRNVYGHSKEIRASKTLALKLITTTFFLTLTNPMTILSFLAVFSAIAGGHTVTPDEALWMLAGIFFGSMSWWFVLSTAIYRTRNYIPSHWLEKIKMISAGILIAFGGWAIGNCMCNICL